MVQDIGIGCLGSSDRVRKDRIDKTGTVTLRVAGHLRHIDIGRTHAGTHVKLLVQNLSVIVVNATTRANFSAS